MVDQCSRDHTLPDCRALILTSMYRRLRSSACAPGASSGSFTVTSRNDDSKLVKRSCSSVSVPYATLGAGPAAAAAAAAEGSGGVVPRAEEDGAPAAALEGVRVRYSKEDCRPAAGAGLPACCGGEGVEVGSRQAGGLM